MKIQQPLYIKGGYEKASFKKIIPAKSRYMGLWKKLCKQYLTKLDKAKITGIGLI